MLLQNDDDYMYDEVDKFHNDQDKALLGSESDSESSEEVCLIIEFF